VAGLTLLNEWLVSVGESCVVTYGDRLDIRAALPQLEDRRGWSSAGCIEAGIWVKPVIAGRRATSYNSFTQPCASSPRLG
jgi:hypothetical protein